MEPQDNLLIFGASTRAAAFSALRAGLLPWCADLFADRDLQARCPVFRLDPDRYPQGFLPLARQDLRGPWMYTGGMENRRGLIRRITRERPLWGNDERTLALARSPRTVARHLKAAGLAHPAVHLNAGDVPRGGRWLVKPRGGVGGTGIRFWDRRALPEGWRRVYFQEYVEGELCAAVYVGDRGHARLLGVTRQLVGQDWLHAGPFRYCGSIGPLALDETLRPAFERLGHVLALSCRLRGVFGIDCVLRDGAPWPVEINPRYTASVELIEYATGIPALALHRQVFDRNAPPVAAEARTPVAVLGKAILFARAPLTFPADGPWMAALTAPGPLDAMPAFADIPAAGERIEAGKPILTFFAQADTASACEEALRRIAADLDRLLYNP